MSEGDSIIFLCVANSARSQMAEGIARAVAPGGWTVYSAGSNPGTVHPHAVEALREIGIDIHCQRSKRIDEVPVDDATIVVTLCTDEVCPVVPQTVRHLHWPLPDPAGSSDRGAHRIEDFRAVRDELRARLEALWSATETR